MSLKWFGQRHRSLIVRVCVLVVFFQCFRDADTLPPNPNGRRTRRRHQALVRIIGGQGCNIQQHPYMVSFVFHSNQQTYCGGALISWRSVLSASHCFADKEKRLSDSVRAGMSFSDEAAAQERKIFNIYKHPQFDASTLQNDIAVVNVEKKFHSTPLVSLVKLPRPPAQKRNASTERDCKTVFTMGWGRTEPELASGKRKKRHTSELQCVHLPVVESEVCRLKYPNAPWIGKQVICTLVPDGTRDTCIGDSGGPLMCDNRGNNTIGLRHVDTVIGVISGSSGCGQPKTPAVNTRVDQYLDFIRKSSSPASKCGNPPPIFTVILSNLSVVVCYMLLLPVI